MNFNSLRHLIQGWLTVLQLDKIGIISAVWKDNYIWPKGFQKVLTPKKYLYLW
jgi:hypothetical protein